MKKIIRHGDPQKIKEILQIRTFECKTCGCIFDADIDDYAEGIIYKPKWGIFRCECPECGKLSEENPV